MGARFVEFGERFDYDDLIPSFVRAVASPRTASEFITVVRDLDADLAVIDMDLASVVEADTGLPTAVIVPTAYHGLLPNWRNIIDAANRLRIDEGFDPLLPPEVAWASRDRTIVTTARAFDSQDDVPANARYVGPVRNLDETGSGWRPPWESGVRPLVLASYSSLGFDNPPERLQAVLDAVAHLPVFAVATTGKVFPATALRTPPNAVALDYVPHWDAMQYMSVCVSHGGHGTTIEALRHGVPVVCVPGMGLDQAWIAGRVTELGVGLAVSDPYAVGDIRAAVEQILADDRYKGRASEFAVQLQGDGASAAVDVLEELLRATRLPGVLA
jgi:MGT family glycosyltransferase